MQRGIAILADLRRKSLSAHALIVAEQENPNYTPAQHPVSLLWAHGFSIRHLDYLHRETDLGPMLRN